MDRPTITVAGFGVKGRPLANFLRDVVGKEVRVYDTTPSGRAAALEAGFFVYEDAHDAGNDAIVLAACQNQIGQVTQFPRNYVFYGEAAYFFDAPMYFDRMRDFSGWILDNRKEIVEFVAELPRTTRDSLASILRYRVSLDPSELAAVRRPVGEMWFDIPTEFRKRSYSCFLDVGAYDGDTLDEASSRALGFTKAFAIEANPEFRDQIMERSQLFPEGLEVVPYAAWSRSAKLHAAEDAFGMVTVTESETGSINAERLDDIVSAPVDFLKMDIEGAEGSALAGAKGILAGAPDIAIAAYHRPDDILTLYQTVAECVGSSFESYQFYVGHYSEWQDDTIYYFLADSGK